MSKPFKSIEEQIVLLKSRGLEFNDEEKAKKYLLCNNYYNVINYYSKFFMISNDQYIKGTTFDEISHIYYFDKEIKTIFFKSILDIEKYFKSLISYFFSESHKEDYAYLNACNFRNDDILKVTQTIASLSKIIVRKQNEKNPNSVKHYINHHHNVPLWVLSNYMTFGQIITFYTHMKDSEKNKIAKIYSQFLSENLGVANIKLSSKHIVSFLKNICEVRNIVAHGNKFLGFKCKENTLYLNELHPCYSVINTAPKQDVFNVYIIMRVFLSKNQFNIMSNSLRKRTIQLSKKINSIDYNIITQSLGFPRDWKDFGCLPQQ